MSSETIANQAEGLAHAKVLRHACCMCLERVKGTMPTRTSNETALGGERDQATEEGLRLYPEVQEAIRGCHLGWAT